MPSQAVSLHTHPLAPSSHSQQLPRLSSCRAHAKGTASLQTSACLTQHCCKRRAARREALQRHLSCVQHRKSAGSRVQKCGSVTVT